MDRVRDPLAEFETAEDFVCRFLSPSGHRNKFFLNLRHGIKLKGGELVVPGSVLFVAAGRDALILTSLVVFEDINNLSSKHRWTGSDVEFFPRAVFWSDCTLTESTGFASSVASSSVIWRRCRLAGQRGTRGNGIFLFSREGAENAAGVDLVWLNHGNSGFLSHGSWERDTASAKYGKSITSSYVFAGKLTLFAAFVLIGSSGVASCASVRHALSCACPV